ncbi:MAG TPA: T9SS type A sorting domain-containing protein, partial [Prolixibacteraceae bacterium]|nr:T9SS type A sorting domain-containing protein [Prolixibacteraceae bacterium]
ITLQCLPDQDYDQYEIPIGIDCKLGGEITFTAESVNLPTGCQALLEDRVTHRFTRLDLKDAQYTANVSADTKGTGRFFLHTSDIISSVPKLETPSFNVYTTGKTVYVNGEVGADAQFFLYSVNGKLLANFKAENQVQNQLNVSGYAAGVYVLTIVDKNVKKSVKLIIR